MWAKNKNYHNICLAYIYIYICKRSNKNYHNVIFKQDISHFLIITIFLILDTGRVLTHSVFASTCPKVISKIQL